ncbi:hypothetical protein BDF21DRAFT_432211 [Thamnidium elegans]|nr:hypothetical protein BDF21DRAFT_432211 [Thamnidium elegans]
MKSACNDQIEEVKTQVRELLGYNIIFRSDSIVRMEPVVVGSGELSFLIKYTDRENEEIVLRIVGSNKELYIEQFHDIYQTYVIEDGNIPAFLNAAALELYGLKA